MEALIQALPAMLAGVARKPGEGVFAWGNQRPFGVGVRDNSLRATALARLYFEPSDAVAVETAAKADTDKVDTSLWAIGDNGPGFEQSRERLRIFLYGVYCRRIYLEAKRWLDNERVSPTLPDFGRSEAGVWTASDATATRIGSNGGTRALCLTGNGRSNGGRRRGTGIRCGIFICHHAIRGRVRLTTSIPG
jgi:hypothetical protein